MVINQQSLEMSHDHARDKTKCVRTYSGMVIAPLSQKSTGPASEIYDGCQLQLQTKKNLLLLDGSHFLKNDTEKDLNFGDKREA